MLIVPPQYDHCVYLLSRRDHVVIYVGVTSNLFARLGHHANNKPWWPEVAFAQVEAFERRLAADQRETHLISILDPFYNIVGSDGGTDRHLEEMRIATAAIRRGRALQPPAPDPRPAVLPVPGAVTLSEALPVLRSIDGRNLALGGLRTAAKRPGFPEIRDVQNRAYLYDLESLKRWWIKAA